MGGDLTFYKEFLYDEPLSSNRKEQQIFGEKGWKLKFFSLFYVVNPKIGIRLTCPLIFENGRWAEGEVFDRWRGKDKFQEKMGGGEEPEGRARNIQGGGYRGVRS